PMFFVQPNAGKRHKLVTGVPTCALPIYPGLNSIPSMLATTLGIEFNPELDWDEREDLFTMSGKIVRTSNITKSAVGNKDGLWTTVFAAAVFINEDNLSVESGKSQADAASGNEDANR